MTPHNLNTPGNDIARFKVKRRLGVPGVSYHGPLTKITPFALVLGESSSLVTTCSWGSRPASMRQLQCVNKENLYQRNIQLVKKV